MRSIIGGAIFMMVSLNPDYMSSNHWKKENAQLKNIVAELELNKLRLKESLDYLKPKAWRLLIYGGRWPMFGKSGLHKNAAPAKRLAWQAVRSAIKQLITMLTVIDEYTREALCVATKPGMGHG
jgi:hypothetical protein